STCTLTLSTANGATPLCPAHNATVIFLQMLSQWMAFAHLVGVQLSWNDKTAVRLLIQFKPPLMGFLQGVHVVVLDQPVPLCIDACVKGFEISIPVLKVMGFRIGPVPWTNL